MTTIPNLHETTCAAAHQQRNENGAQASRLHTTDGDVRAPFIERYKKNHETNKDIDRFTRAECTRSSLWWRISMEPDSVSIDMQGLQEEWQATLVPGSPYDASMPPEPMGIPEHIQITFGGATPDTPDYSGPILYIVPVDAHKQLWDEADNPSVSNNLDNLESILKDRPDLSTVDARILPYEVHRYINPGGSALSWQRAYVDTPWGSGIRSVTQPSQSPNVITNQRLFYVEQGLTDDGQYLVSFIYPVRTDALPDTGADVPQEELDQVNSGDQDQYSAYRQAKQELLDGLSTSDWEPDLAILDAAITSLQFGDYGK